MNQARILLHLSTMRRGRADMNAILVQPISGPSVDPWRNERQAFGLELCLRLFFPR